MSPPPPPNPRMIPSQPEEEEEEQQEHQQQEHPDNHDHHLSAEEIQDLYGALMEDHHHHHPFPPASTDRHSGSSFPPLHHFQDHVPAAAASAPPSTTSDGEEQDNTIPEDCKTQARTERKRSREKQRRSDVNKQFQELTNVLRRLEANLQQQQSSNEVEVAPLLPLANLAPFSPSNRVDLIARTITMLQTLETERTGLHKRLKQSQEALQAAQKAGEETAAKLKDSMTQPVGMNGRMVMMVPMMIGGGNGEATAPGMTAAPGGGMFLPPGMMMQPYAHAGPDGSSAAGTAMPATGMHHPMMSPWGMMPPQMMHPHNPWGMMQPQMAAMPQHAQWGSMTAAPAPQQAHSQQQQQQPLSNASEESKPPASASNANNTGNLAHCA